MKIKDSKGYTANIAAYEDDRRIDIADKIIPTHYDPAKDTYEVYESIWNIREYLYAWERVESDDDSRATRDMSAEEEEEYMTKAAKRSVIFEELDREYEYSVFLYREEIDEDRQRVTGERLHECVIVGKVSAAQDELMEIMQSQAAEHHCTVVAEVYEFGRPGMCACWSMEEGETWPADTNWDDAGNHDTEWTQIGWGF